MMRGFTDEARAAMIVAFRPGPVAAEGMVLRALAGRPRGLAGAILSRAGVEPGHLPAVGPEVDRLDLLAAAAGEARRAGAHHVGTEHLLIAVARRPGSALSGLGITPDRLDALRLAVEAGRRARPGPIRRAWRRLAGS